MFISELFENNGRIEAIRQQKTDNIKSFTHQSPDEQTFVEDARPQVVVLYPGRFQPFHLGHADVFRSLQSKFGREHVYIATSNKTDSAKSPFNFSDKTVFMTAAGVPVDRILEVATPYKLPAQFNDSNTIFIVTVGAPDAERLQPGKLKKDGQQGYFLNFKSLEDCVTADQHGYCIIAEERKRMVTINGKQYDASHGTECRNLWNMVRNDPKGRAEFLKQLYGRNDPEIGRILDKIPAPVNENIEKKSSRYKASVAVPLTGKNFNQKVFESLSDYAKFLMTPKNKVDRIHKCRHWPTNLTELSESMDLNDQQARNLADLVNSLDMSEGIDIKVGNKVALLHTMSIAALKQIDVFGYVTPKTIEEIHLNNNGKIDFIEFDDGTQYPSAGEVVNVGGENLTNTAMFPDLKSATEAYSKIWFTLQNMKGSGWKINTQLSECAGVGVVKNSKDPRYMMATMGLQNDVRAETMPKSMKALGLVGRKNPGRIK